MLHGLDVDPLARDAGRVLVLRVDLVEARGLALGLLHGLRLVALGFLDDGGRGAARLRHHLVGVALSLVAQPLLVLLGRRHVAEGRNDLLGRIDRQQLHLQDEDAGVVVVQHLLDQVLDRGFDRLAAGGEDVLDLRAADHLAHGAFGHRFHGLVGVAQVERVNSGFAGSICQMTRNFTSAMLSSPVSIRLSAGTSWLF